MLFNSGRAVTRLGQGCRTAAVVLALGGGMAPLAWAESEMGIGGNSFSATGSPNQVGQQSMFSKTGQAINKSASKLSRSVRSAFQKKSAKEPTTPSESFGNSKKSRNPDPALFVAFARVQEQGRNYAEAAVQYEKALAKDPEYLDAILGLANLDLHQGEYELSAELYQRAIEIDPKQAAAHNGLALCYVAEQRQSEALTEFEQAIALEPASKLYRNNIARELIRAGRGQEAFNHLRTAYDPAVAAYNMGFLYNENGDPQAAMFHFQRALELNPKFPQAQQWLATLSQKHGAHGIAHRPQVPGQLRASQQIVNRQIVNPVPDARQHVMVPTPVQPDVAGPPRTAMAPGRPGDIVFVPPLPGGTPVDSTGVDALPADEFPAAEANVSEMENLPGIATTETAPTAAFSVENVVAPPMESDITEMDDSQESSIVSEPPNSPSVTPIGPTTTQEPAPYVASRPKRPITQVPSRNSESVPARETSRANAAPPTAAAPVDQTPDAQGGLHWVLPGDKPPVAVKITGTVSGKNARDTVEEGVERLARRTATTTGELMTESVMSQQPTKPQGSTKRVRGYRPPSRY